MTDMAERTKLWIADKMKDLMKRTPIGKIRVSEICEAAEIDRSTFYYHFKDKYALVAWIFFSSAKGVEVADPDTAAGHMRQMKQDMLFYKRAFEDTSQNALWQYMLEYFVEENNAAVKAILGTDELDAELSFDIRFYCYGAVGMTREWILQDSPESAETFVRMTFALMPPALKEIYYGQS